MKLSGKATETCLIIYPHTPKIHQKFNGVFGNLLQTMTLYLEKAKDWIAADPERVLVLHNMSIQSMFYNISAGLVKNCNCEGAILL